MTPLPDNQTVIVLIDSDGNPLKAASNLSFNLNIQVTTNPHEYVEKSKGLPYAVEPKS
jgi:hypothetical protein